MDLSQIRRVSARQLARLRRASANQLNRLRKASEGPLEQIKSASENQLNRLRSVSAERFDRLRSASAGQLSRLSRVSRRQMQRIREFAAPKSFSAMADIPNGQASDKITEGALVLEGGAFRGLYSQGVLDALMENDINFSCVVGVSAGALAGLNYCSGQIGRSARINLAYRHDSRYVGVRALRKAHSIVNLDFILKDVNAYEPFNEQYFRNPERKYVAVCANVNTGKAEYMEKSSCSDIIAAAKASASMPYVSPEVIIDGQPYLDGGTSCKIAYQWAIDQGYEKIVVIRTRQREYRKKPMTRENEMAEFFYRRNPQFAKALADSNINYNRQCDELISLEKQGRIFVIAPEKEVKVSRVESDVEKLGELYFEGYREMLEHLDELKAYLNR